MKKLYYAKTHTPEYMLHKYWARKPYNVLSQLISDILPHKGLVFDPFCGSGVFLNEAKKLGHNGIGYDANPVSANLANITCNPPQVDKFKKVLTPIINNFLEYSNIFYQVDDFQIKYAVHSIVTKCSKCNAEYYHLLNTNDKKISKCNSCNTKVFFNLEHLQDTKVLLLVGPNNQTFENKNIINKFLKKENDINHSDLFNEAFIENRRILSFKGLTTSSFFTKRNFHLLTYLANQLYEINDERIRNSALLMFTSSIIQSSRLIAYRNNLKTGGPAWSVPGFWVPRIHLESNPGIHIKARFLKYLKGLKILNMNTNGKVKIFLKSSTKFSKNHNNFDLIFLDPPYGDSIPYLEFSNIWNSFLKKKLRINNDISVSDRLGDKEKSWNNYENSLNKIIYNCNKSLKKNGKILVTFNNFDDRAWYSLINPLQENGFRCLYCMYQLPAVVSSKAQFSRENSYISDFYILFSIDKKISLEKNYKRLKDNLITSAILSNNVISKSKLYRVLYLNFLKYNIQANLLFKVNDLLKSIFINNDNYYSLRNKLNASTIKDQFMNKLKKFISKDKNLNYNELINFTEDFGLIDISEINSILPKNNNLNKNLDLFK